MRNLTNQAETFEASHKTRKHLTPRIAVATALAAGILCGVTCETMAQEGSLFSRGNSRSGRESGLSSQQKADLAIGIIGAAIRHHKSSQPTRRQPSYPTYRQPSYPTYRAPSVSSSSTSRIVQKKPQTVSPKRNVLPPKPKPIAKPIGNEFKFNMLSNDVQLDDAKDRVDEQIVKKTDELEGLAAADVDNVANQAKSSITDPADQQAFIEATQTGDKDTAKRLADKHGVNPALTEALLQTMENEDLAIQAGDAVRNGASGPEIDQLLEQLAQAHQESGGFSTIHPMQLDGLLNDVSVGTHTRDAIDSALASSFNADIPRGSCDVYTVPGLPEGCVMATANGQLIQSGDSLGFRADVPVEDTLGVSVPTDEPLGDTAGAEQVESGVLMRNPKESGGTIHYTVDGSRHSMQVGQSQKLSGSKSRIIAFDRGGSFGQAKYTLSEGAYIFAVTEKGWELKQQSFQVTLSNVGNTTAFHYVVMGKQESISAGGEKTHSSKYPIVVTFDRGDGGEPAAKTLASGTYTVGLDSDEKRYDLFDETAMQTANSEAVDSHSWSESVANRPRGATRGDYTARVHDKGQRPGIARAREVSDNEFVIANLGRSIKTASHVEQQDLASIRKRLFVRQLEDHIASEKKNLPKDLDLFVTLVDQKVEPSEIVYTYELSGLTGTAASQLSYFEEQTREHLGSVPKLVFREF